MRQSTHDRDVIGLIPAGGMATRLGTLPCSKEILPLSYSEKAGRLRVASEPLLESFKIAGVHRVFFILRDGKWDIPRFYGDGSRHGLNIGYLMMNRPFGVPFTLDQAFPFCERSNVALGWSDILFQPPDGYRRLLDKLFAERADLVLGLFPIEHYRKWDMVETDQNGAVRRLVIKPQQTQLRFGWTLAVWSPVFTRFLHEQIEVLAKQHSEGKVRDAGGHYREPYIGDIFQRAIDSGMACASVSFEDGECLDIGTADNLNDALARELAQSRSEDCKPSRPAS
jgi:glucose-1-phosphate thymidylyltransferase